MSIELDGRRAPSVLVQHYQSACWVQWGNKWKILRAL